jgi:uncharacterized protein YbbC (DUF1343 family)
LDVAIAALRGEDGGVPRETARLLKTGRLGLVTNPSAVTRDLVAAPDALREAGAQVRALFGPEHGVRGDIADGVKIGNSVDERTGIPVYSLYGATPGPTPEMLQGLDALVFDIQDVGARFYTFTSTLSHVMTSARAAKLPVIVLDRPNPLGGEAVEGPILEPEHRSFVGMHPIPIRHGATMGELGRLWARFGAGEDPVVIRCAGLKREHLWPDTGLQWIAPSPNMPHWETALVYPSMCLLEGTNLSEARGTTNPFRTFGAPWIKPEELADALNAEMLPGVRFRPVRFIPTASKHRDLNCSGCQLHVLEPDAFRPVATGVAVLSVVRRLYPERFAWLRSGEKFSVDRLAGSTAIRTQIDGGQTWEQIAASWDMRLEGHRGLLREVRLYR